MRKFIALGLGAVTTATLAFSSLSPAGAAISPPGSQVGQLCATLPAQVTSAVTSATSAGLAQAAAAADLAAKTTAFAPAQTNLVTALVDYLTTIDTGGSVGAKSLILQDAMSVYVEKATAWGNASSAVDVANRNVSITAMNSTVLQSLLSALGGCV
jgi:hypothetical protein